MSQRLIDDDQGPEYTSGDPFFVFIGTRIPEAAVDKAKASGIYYHHKMLESGPANWERIIEMLRSAEIRGVIVKFTSRYFEMMVWPDYQSLGVELLEALGRTEHAVFVHEANMIGSNREESPVPDGEEPVLTDYYSIPFSPPKEATRQVILERFDKYGINVVPYRTNAELSVLTSAFIEDNENNLLFRLYVPSGRLYAAEAEKLIGMFREWLTKVKQLRIREDGYSTARGQVFEFFGDDESGSVEMSKQFADFSQFLDLCVDAPEKAADALSTMGVDSAAAAEIARRYGKETRRLQLDLRHAREAKVMAIQHRLESELIDQVDDAPSPEQTKGLIEALVPQATQPSVAIDPPRTRHPAQPSSPAVVVNQQFIGSVEGIVAQEVHGEANLGAKGPELLKLIQEFGGEEAHPLRSAVYELEDSDARPDGRLAAKQKLKGFLYKLGGKVEDGVLKALFAYVEQKTGLSP